MKFELGRLDGFRFVKSNRLRPEFGATVLPLLPRAVCVYVCVVLVLVAWAIRGPAAITLMAPLVAVYLLEKLLQRQEAHAFAEALLDESQWSPVGAVTHQREMQDAMNAVSLEMAKVAGIHPHMMGMGSRKQS